MDKETLRIEDRNETTHTYQEATAEAVFKNLRKYLKVFKKLHDRLAALAEEAQA